MKAIAIFTILLLSAQVYADLPIHCLRHEIIGQWNYELAEPSAKKGDESFVTCGHEQPDNADSSYKAMNGSLRSVQQKFKLLLSDNDEVSGEKEGEHGSWTMVYDEGFQVNINDMSLFAFNKYKPNSANDMISDCSQTLVGWYHNQSTGEKGCYRAYKDGGEIINEAVAQGDAVLQPKDTYTGFLQKEEKPVDKYDQSQYKEDDMVLHKGFDDHQTVVDRLNKVENKSWQAGISKDFEELNLAQINSKAGRRKHKSRIALAETKAKAQNKNKSKTSDEQEDPQYKHFSREDVSDLPKNFNWAKYINEPYQQRDCGSCYAIASFEMYQARLKIHHNDYTDLSVQDMLDCNMYNQGCDGGYGFLVHKYASEYDLVPERCKPYKAANGMCGHGCEKNELKKAYRVTDYKFIGGAYERGSERQIMEEIKENGPIVMSFEPPMDFMYYQGGVYHSVDANYWIKNNEPEPEWEKVDHSVLAYGWGETEEGEKYWMFLNSWGENWGERGHFRMRRGTDESAIESMGEAATISVIEKGSDSFLQMGQNISLVEQSNTKQFRK